MIYKGLTNLGLELVSFNLEDVKKELLDVLANHSDSLRHLSLARNKISNDFMKAMCQSLTGGMVSLEYIDLRHLKEASKVGWPDMLASLAALSQPGRSKPLVIRVSDY